MHQQNGLADTDRPGSMTRSRTAIPRRPSLARGYRLPQVRLVWEADQADPVARDPPLQRVLLSVRCARRDGAPRLQAAALKVVPRDLPNHREREGHFVEPGEADARHPVPLHSAS